MKIINNLIIILMILKWAQSEFYIKSYDYFTKFIVDMLDLE